MSLEDGLVMQLHIGSLRDHNPDIFQRFGRDRGADIPIATEFTRNLKPLLDLYGRRTDLTLVLFNLDETTYSREAAPLAGHYPALRRAAGGFLIVFRACGGTLTVLWRLLVSTILLVLMMTPALIPPSLHVMTCGGVLVPAGWRVWLCRAL